MTKLFEELAFCATLWVISVCGDVEFCLSMWMFWR